jgi:hypothetical protein
VALEAVTAARKSDPNGGLDFAWRVHGALDSWTGKVDSKASIILAIESAALGFILTLSKKGERLASLDGASETAYRLAIGALVLAVLFALLVVMPQLRRRQAKKNWRKGMVYFGHLRHWDPVNLAKALQTNQVYESQLAHQLVTMSEIAWKKHARLQWSVGFLIAGAACLIFAIVAS